MDSLAVEQPRVDQAMARKVAADAYGLRVSATPLAGERDRNFLLRSAEGRRWVLKFYNSAESDAVCDFQETALLYLERHRSPSVPRLIPTLDGRRQFVVGDQGQTEHGILVTFLDGVPMAEAPMTSALRRDIGRTCATLDRALEALEHPAAHRRLLWDPMQIDDLLPMTESVTDEGERRWLARFGAYFVGEARPALRQCRSQTIHNDMNTSNVLIDTQGPGRVSGIIDFGDMVHAPLVNEIGIAASYVARPGDDLFGVIADLVEGFEEIIELTEQEMACLYDVVVARLVVRLLIYQWRSALFPENRKYILRNSESAWAMIRAVMRRSADEGRSQVMQRWRTGAAHPAYSR